MPNAVWCKALKASADPARAGAALAPLEHGPAAAFVRDASPELARALAALFSGSQAMGELLVKHPAWLPRVSAWAGR